MELKRDCTYLAPHHNRYAFNRTIVELKHVQSAGLAVDSIAFNRTIVELKPGRVRDRLGTSQQLLIEPLWN